MSARLRTKHYSIRTERAYCGWARRFILFHGKRHPKEMGSAEVEAFLTHLALAGQVAASTQNQAKSALLFLYKEVLRVDLPWLDNITQAKTLQRLPVVLTQSEVKRVLDRLEGTGWLMASLLYGAGLRLLECLRLCVKDVDSSGGKSWYATACEPADGRCFHHRAGRQQRRGFPAAGYFSPKRAFTPSATRGGKKPPPISFRKAFRSAAGTSSCSRAKVAASSSCSAGDSACISS